MFSPLTTFVALGLVLVAGLLITSHFRSWRAVREEASDGEERRFAWHQFRRRVQASGMIGLVGAAILVGQFIVAPLLGIIFWAGVMLVLVWILLLAGADIVATQQHFGRLRRRELAEQARLQAELRERTQHRGNGRGPGGGK